MEQETLHAVSVAADKATIGAAGVSFLGGLTANDVAAYGGLAIAVIGATVAAIFKWLEHNERKRHNKVMEAKRWSDE